MQASSLTLTLTNVKGAPIDTTVRLELIPTVGSPGGQHMRTPEFNMNGAASCRVGGIPSLDVGTQYQVGINAQNYQTTSFFLRVVPGEQKTDPFSLVADPSRVKGIDAPAFDQLDNPRLRQVLNASASSVSLSPGSVELGGVALYSALTDMQKACLLNISAKANHWTAKGVWERVQALILIQQDRFFAFMDADTEDALNASPRFGSAGKSLHHPLDGFELIAGLEQRNTRNAAGDANEERAGGQWAADIDIDEDTGIGHGFEVIRNAITQGLTNPYQVHELMLLGEPNDSGGETKVDPGYKLLLA